MESEKFNLRSIRPGDIGVQHNGERRLFLRFDPTTDFFCPYIFEDGDGGECGRDEYGRLTPGSELVHRDVELIERAPARPGEWQPIETAPKDGTEILLGHWFVDDPDGYHGGDRWLWIASGSVADDGMFDCDFTDEYFKPEFFHKVTHWMPLPKPPVPSPSRGDFRGRGE